MLALSLKIFRTLTLHVHEVKSVALLLNFPTEKFNKKYVTSTSRGYRSSACVKLEFSNDPGTSSSIPKVRNLLGGHSSNSTKMGYFVIGVSGVTCGGKTTLTKLLQRKLPWARIIHQDHYFRDDDWPHHIRCPEAENHVNYEVFQSLDMEKMFEDVRKILEAPPTFANMTAVSNINQQPDGNCSLLGDKAETPNFEGGDKFLQEIKDIDVDVSKYKTQPILIIEGFTIFASQFLFDKCHARFFCTLDKETCLKRRTQRSYIPPDSPSYFEKVIWPEYEKHLTEFIDKRPGITVFDGNIPIENIWKDSVQIVTCRIEEHFGDKRQDLSA